jgi:hypothetical protein
MKLDSHPPHDSHSDGGPRTRGRRQIPSEHSIIMDAFDPAGLPWYHPVIAHTGYQSRQRASSRGWSAHSRRRRKRTKRDGEVSWRWWRWWWRTWRVSPRRCCATKHPPGTRKGAPQFGLPLAPNGSWNGVGLVLIGAVLWEGWGDCGPGGRFVGVFTRGWWCGPCVFSRWMPLDALRRFGVVVRVFNVTAAGLVGCGGSEQARESVEAFSLCLEWEETS